MTDLAQRQERVLALAAPGQRRRAAKGAGCQDGGVEVLNSRILLRPADLGRSGHFYRDVLGLAVYRELGSPGDPGVVFFVGSEFLVGSGFLEVSGHSAGTAGHAVMIWLQVRDVNAEHERLAAAGARVLREPVTEWRPVPACCGVLRQSLVQHAVASPAVGSRRWNHRTWVSSRTR